MSWIARAKVGDKVVCVDTSPHDEWHTQPVIATAHEYIVMGNVYTIKEFCSHLRSNYMHLRLVECDRRTPFNFMRFRPVKDTTHQVEALKRLCNPTPEVVA